MISSGRHPKKEVQQALEEARKAGFRVEESKNGHRWGWVICCGCKDKETVSGTPKNAGTEAKRVRQFIRQHKGH
ncbi:MULTISPECIES: hypothetical protein [Streptomyces]|uniref:hypothetical protein n=1 Tax=Streptomyces TaxID=1883 RepID=UPI000CD550FE|nr:MULTISPECIES: hypothetical protein [Streptomyces]